MAGQYNQRYETMLNDTQKFVENLASVYENVIASIEKLEGKSEDETNYEDDDEDDEIEEDEDILFIKNTVVNFTCKIKQVPGFYVVTLATFCNMVAEFLIRYVTEFNKYKVESATAIIYKCILESVIFTAIAELRDQQQTYTRTAKDDIIDKHDQRKHKEDEFLQQVAHHLEYTPSNNDSNEENIEDEEEEEF